MNYSKIVLVGFISAFVALLTSVLGVAGTVIGSVISSVLYNMLSEALEKPVSDVASKTKHSFEWDIAYVFPIVVIALIQLLLICSFLSEWGVLPSTFLNAYLSLQNLASNNLYRILGLALLVISIYPLLLKPENVKKAHGLILAFVGIIFLARGFVDLHNSVTDIYDGIFAVFDFPIAVFALVLLVIVIVRILMSAHESDDDSTIDSRSVADKIQDYANAQYQEQKDFEKNYRRVVKVRKKPSSNDSKKYFQDDTPKSRIGKFSKELSNKEVIKEYKYKVKKVPNKEIIDESVSEDKTVLDDEVISQHEPRINKSSKNIHFESNDLLDDYKR